MGNSEKKSNYSQKKMILIAFIIIIMILLIFIGVTFAIVTSQNKIETASKSNQLTQTDVVTQDIQNAKAVQSSELVDNENMTVQTDIEGKKVPVPRGYVGSQAKGENEISKGYVIYEGEDPVTDTNVAEAQETRNQYVWVPVPDVNKMYGTDSSGKKWGKLYNFATSSSNANYDATTGAYPLNWSEINGVMYILHSADYVEPSVLGILSSYDNNRYLKQYGLGSMTRHDLLLEMQKDFNNMINSVKKYGGFYIGRYETGNLSQDIVVVQKGNTDIDEQTWYTMYKKCKKLKGANKQVETGMIWGCQWDRTLMWLVESGNRSITEICENSTSWGNYSDAIFTYTNTSGGTSMKNNGSHTIIPTGSADYTKANNIYDLAGNMREWTMEAANGNNRISRSGYYYWSGSEYPASYRRTGGNNIPSDDGNGQNSRSSLYIRCPEL